MSWILFYFNNAACHIPNVRCEWDVNLSSEIPWSFWKVCTFGSMGCCSSFWLCNISKYTFLITNIRMQCLSRKCCNFEPISFRQAAWSRIFKLLHVHQVYLRRKKGTKHSNYEYFANIIQRCTSITYRPRSRIVREFTWYKRLTSSLHLLLTIFLSALAHFLRYCLVDEASTAIGMRLPSKFYRFMND